MEMMELAKKDEHLRKPEWLKIKLNTNENYTGLKKLMRENNLHTVCEEAKCPNIHECWAVRRTATFMILGSVCTRACRFCAVKTGSLTELDLNEPERVADSVSIMNLKHAVITAVARDDLKDGGAGVFAETVRAVRRKSPFTTIEVLPSDMGGDYNNLKTLMDTRPDILNHNIETVRRLTPRVRARATYERSLEFLRRQRDAPGHPDEIQHHDRSWRNKRRNHRNNGRPSCEQRRHHGNRPVSAYSSKKHIKVQKYYHPDEFAELKEIAMEKGFSHCEAGPLVRSSYHADEQVNEASKKRQAQA